MRMGIRDNEKVILFFGNIAPYKGLEDTVGRLTTSAYSKLLQAETLAEMLYENQSEASHG